MLEEDIVLSQREARERIRKSFPGRTVSVAATEWWIAATDKVSAHEWETYVVTLQPGLAGEKVTIWQMDTLDGVVAACLTDRRCTAMPDERRVGCGLCAHCRAKEQERLGCCEHCPANPDAECIVCGRNGLPGVVGAGVPG